MEISIPGVAICECTTGLKKNALQEAFEDSNLDLVMLWSKITQEENISVLNGKNSSADYL